MSTTTADTMRHAPTDHDRPDYCHHIGWRMYRTTGGEVRTQWVEMHTGRSDDDGAHISWSNDWEAVYRIAADPTDQRITERTYGPGTFGHVSYFLHT